MDNVKKRWAKSLAGRVAVGGALALVAASVFVGSTAADAVVGGTATADAVDVNLAFAAPLAGLGATGGTTAQSAPATNGTNSSGPGASAQVGTQATATTSVVDASATRGITSLSASSDLNSTAAGNGSLPNGFTYTAASSVLTIVPNNGPTAGGTATVITGTGFTGATGVTFDLTPGSSFTVVNDTTINVTTPAGLAGPADVLVLDAAGNGSLPGGFTYTSPASLLSIVPSSGPETGGTPTTLTGTGFTGATGVTFDGLPGTSFVVVNDSTITVTTPLGAVGPADVTVVDAAGNGSLPGGFTYIAVSQPSTILSIVPNVGPTQGGTATTVTGSGFLGATAVTFDGAAGTSFVVVNDTTITVTTPPGAVGPANVVVVDAAGNGNLANGFTYVNAASAILTIVPNQGPTIGGTLTTISGTGFSGATGVTFDGSLGTSFTVVNDTTITVTTPAGVQGPADVLVLDASGNGSLPGGFTYTQASSIVSITPDSGPDIGGTPVTITGTGFTGATGVTFDGVPGTSFVVVNETTITVTTPPGAVGPADVVVIDAAGNGTRPGGFTYLAELPDTGVDTSWLLLVGTCLLLAGLAVRWATRRRPLTIA